MTLAHGRAAKTALVAGVVLGLIVALVWTVRAYSQYARMRKAVDVLRFVGSEEYQGEWPIAWALEHVTAHGRADIDWLVEESAATPGSLLPKALYGMCMPRTVVDPCDPGEPLHDLVPALPARERLLRKIAIYRVYCGNQPEYVDLLIETVDNAPDRRLGFVPARIAVSSLNASAGTKFEMPSTLLRQAEGGVEDNAVKKAEERAAETARAVHAEMRDWWKGMRSSWGQFCRDHDVSGVMYDPPTLVDAHIWNEALAPHERFPLPEEPTDDAVPETAVGP